jgi:uncharacterized protein YbjT (DUF2867 family)
MILVTGASGNVGKEVLKQIAQTGVRVRATFQSPSSAASAPSGLEIAIMDYNKPETIRAALKGVEQVFLVGPPTEKLPALERQAVDQIRQSAVRHLVKLSAMGGREAMYPRLHADSEDYIEKTGVAYTFIRPNGFMQNFVNFNAGTINTQNAFYGCQGEGKVSHIDIRDIAAVATKVLTENGHEGKIYTITGPVALSNTQIAQILSDDLGREVRYVDLPPQQFKQALLGAGSPEWGAEGLVNLHDFYRAGKASAVTGDVEKLLGRKPTSFEQFSRDYRDAFRREERAAG